MRIEIKAIDLELQKPVKTKHYFIELTENHLIFSFHIIAKEPIEMEDPGMGWTQKENFCETMILKNLIGGFEIWRVDWEENERWGLAIFPTGLDNIKMFFDKKEEAFSVRNKILNWLK